MKISKVRSVPRGAGAGRVGGGARERVSLAAARLLVDFPVRCPGPWASPDAIYVRGDPPGGRVSLVYGALVLTQFRGDVGTYIEKSLGPGTRLNRVIVRGAPGLPAHRPPARLRLVDARGAGARGDAAPGR